MFIDKLSGEAYGLRALNYYYLLMAHGGWTEDGKLLGVPMLLEPESTTSDFNQARAPFSECVQQIFEDLLTLLKNYFEADCFKSIAFISGVSDFKSCKSSISLSDKPLFSG